VSPLIGTMARCHHPAILPVELHLLRDVVPSRHGRLDPLSHCRVGVVTQKEEVVLASVLIP
jgi:hypothetical protein